MSRSPASTEQRVSTGHVSEGFESVKTLFDRYLLEDVKYSVQLAAYWRGVKVLDLVGGPDTSRDSVTGVFSGSKGVSGLCVALLVEQGRLDLDATVTTYWPQFGAAGKAAVTVRQLLSHQVGLPGFYDGVTFEELCDSASLAAQLADASPVWRPGSCFGYHTLTLGVFIEELFRRITAGTVQDFYDQHIRVPHGVEFYLGISPDIEKRYREVLPLEPSPAELVWLHAVQSDPDGLAGLANDRHRRVELPSATVHPLLPNVALIRSAGVASVGGVGTAEGLARAYAVCATGLEGEQPLLSPTTMTAVSEQQSWGIDRILHREMGFAVVFEKPQHELEFGSYRAFGHDGAGGALGFADPMYELAFGHIPQRMTFPGGADPRAIELSKAIRQTIANM